MTTNISIENVTQVVAVNLAGEGSSNVVIEISSVNVQASTVGIQGRPGLGGAELAPRIEALESSAGSVPIPDNILDAISALDGAIN